MLHSLPPTTKDRWERYLQRAIKELEQYDMRAAEADGKRERDEAWKFYTRHRYVAGEHGVCRICGEDSQLEALHFRAGESIPSTESGLECPLTASETLPGGIRPGEGEDAVRGILPSETWDQTGD